MDRTFAGAGTREWDATPAANRVAEYRLAGRLVSREMHADATLAKRQGLRVLLTTPGGSELAQDGATCGNCGGVGHLFLQSLIAGPFREPPQKGKGESVGVYNGRWWKMTLQAYPCPACAGRPGR